MVLPSHHRPCCSHSPAMQLRQFNHQWLCNKHLQTNHRLCNRPHHTNQCCLQQTFHISQRLCNKQQTIRGRVPYNRLNNRHCRPTRGCVTDEQTNQRLCTIYTLAENGSTHTLVVCIQVLRISVWSMIWAHTESRGTVSSLAPIRY